MHSDQRTTQWRGWAVLSGLLLVTALASGAVVEAMGKRAAREAPSEPPPLPAVSEQPPTTSHESPVTRHEPAEPAPSRVAIREGSFYVDGERFFVKGVGYSPARPGTLPWRERAELALVDRDFQQIRDAGFNTVRTWTPLSPEELALARKHDLMVLQGIWIDRPKDYRAAAYRQEVARSITSAVTSMRGHDNILAVLVGNELPAEHVFIAGVKDTEALLRSMAEAARAADPSRLVSFANWPETALLDQSMFDLLSYNTYTYSPPSVAHSLGFQGYLEHLKRAQGADRPVLATEFGLSVSPQGTGRPGYGGNTPEEQAKGVVAMWDSVVQSGIQGGCVFEWMDEWWKNYDYPGDERMQDEDDPEEWFGLMAVTDAAALHGTPRPALEALRRYNQAVVLSPSTGPVSGRVPIDVYDGGNVATVRFRVDDGDWQPVAQEGSHWWRGSWDATGSPSGVRRVTVEAVDGQGQVITTVARPVWNISHDNPRGLPWTVSVATARTDYVTEGKLTPVTFDITVRNVRGEPVAGQKVAYAITEPQIADFLQDVQLSNAEGLVRVKYLVRESGILSCSAGVEFVDGAFRQRYGHEQFIVVQGADRLPGSGVATARPSSPLRDRLGASLAPLLEATPAWPLFDPGTEPLVDYHTYGEFVGVNGKGYRYKITDRVGLAKAAGEGIYPNDSSIYRDPAYRQREQAGHLEGDHWDFVNLDDTQLCFLKWATTDEEPGVQQFYAATQLERAGHVAHAIKAYYAILVHFPQSIGWTAFQTPWSVGKAAIDRLHFLTRLHPELGLELVDADVWIDGGFDNNVNNDVFYVNPGRLVRRDAAASSAVVPPQPIKQTMGQGRVRLVEFANGHWQLLVDGQPYVVRGITYSPSAVGESPDFANMLDWTVADRNGNHVVDVLETWVDANRNNQRDANEPVVGDFALLKQMGVNTIRMFHHGAQHSGQINKATLRKLYDDYGIRVIMGDFVGMYTVGSGAIWEDGTDYRDPVQCERMLESVKQMVMEFKDEPYLLMWALGNENNYGGMHGIIGGVGNAGKYPDIYYAFINRLATWIHKVDPNHPVMIGNGEVLYLDVLAKHAPAVDIIGINSYRGAAGFSHTLWKDVQRVARRPALITEYGCPSYHKGTSLDAAAMEQAQYHLGNWLGIEQNLSGHGVGNALGGSLFEWSDEWWKAGQPPRFDPAKQETHPGWAAPFPGGWNYEEWYGIVSQGDGRQSPFLRQLRSTYTLYQRLWSSSGAASH